MITGLIIYTGFLTLLIVGGIHSYEAKVKSYKDSIEDYKRALNIAKHHSNAEHYTHLQIENHKLKKDMQYLSDANDHLQAQNKTLKTHNQELTNLAGSQDIQYEHSTYKSNTWDSSKHETQVDFE